MKFLNLLQPAEMADIMRADGKIYVVVAGLVILLVGVLFYLFSMDRKITKLEKEVENSKRP
jgi:CcmD family protein